MTALLQPDDLLSGDYDTVILAMPDLQGRLIGKRMSPKTFVDKLEAGMPICTCALAWDMEQGLGMSFEFAGMHTGWHDFNTYADLDTLRPAGWLPRTAICMADAVDERAGDAPLHIAPRTVLRRQVESITSRDLTAQVASELEFFLYRTPLHEARRNAYRDLEPTNRRHVNFSIQSGNEHDVFFTDLRKKLDATGLGIGVAEVEYGLGQWEINLEHSDPVDMADRHSLFKLAVKDTATAAGMSVTFMPRPTITDIGSSCHMHLSLQDAGGRGLFHDAQAEHHVSAALRGAIGGVLQHAPDFMYFYAPTVNAYKRTASDEFAGRGKTWGYDNRTVSLRVVGATDSSTRLEWRVPGADVNPYLAFSALLASAVDGMDSGTDPGAPVVDNAYDRTDLELLPADLGSAVRRFETSAFVEKALGRDVAAHYSELGRFEWAEFLRQVTDWETVRYFEQI